MHTYCSNCKNHTGNVFLKKLVLISMSKIKGKSICAICLIERTFIYETEGKYALKSELEIYLQFFIDWCYKRTWRLTAWSIEKILKI